MSSPCEGGKGDVNRTDAYNCLFLGVKGRPRTDSEIRLKKFCAQAWTSHFFLAWAQKLLSVDQVLKRCEQSYIFKTSALLLEDVSESRSQRLPDFPRELQDF